MSRISDIRASSSGSNTIIAAVHWPDASVDVPAYRFVDTSDRPRAGRFQRRNLRRRCDFAGAGAYLVSGGVNDKRMSASV